MAKRFSLEANTRDQAPAVIRRAGGVPAVLYGHGLESQSLKVDGKSFNKMYGEAGSTSLISLTIDGKEFPVFVREIQQHPVDGRVLHIDFYQVKMNEKMTASVPLNFVGNAPAVIDMGGTLVRNVVEVEVSALPLDLPHDIEVDISSLDDFEKVIRIEDLNIPENVELHHEVDETIVLVQAPKSQEEIDEELAAEVSEDVESVEGVADKEEETEGEDGSEGEAGSEEASAEGEGE